MATTLSQAGSLLPFHQHILENVHDPSTSDLIILARGLGLRRVVCTLLQIYDGPQNLVLLVNASPEEEASIGEQLGVMGCRKPGLRVVGYEMGRKERQVLYKQGGLISVTSRILVVDMLQADIPTEMITALMVLHAEKITALSLEAFIIRLFREKNSAGCVKAFSDAPEHITSGFYPLKAIMKELQLSRVHIYPRFHVEIKRALERRRADVVELYQGLSASMQDIHHSIVQCMSATLAELKRSNTTLELDDLNIENAYFRSFDAIVRRQLDPVWHKVGPKTKQLVGDLATLRNLLNYLLSYDPLAFHAYLETLIASNSTSAMGGKRQHQSLWLFMDAAHTIFQTAKHRCYVSSGKQMDEDKKKEPKQTQYEIELVDDEDAWAALDEAEGRTEVSSVGPAGARESRNFLTQSSIQPTARKEWLPKGMEPVLEELPKWSLLADVLQEIEEEMVRLMSSKSSLIPGTDTVLVMCSNQRTCEVLSDYLGSLDRRSPREKWGRRMMERRLRLYLWWKARLNANRKEGVETSKMPGLGNEEVSLASRALGADGNVVPGVQKGLSEALKRKDALMREKSMSRRRVRGGAPGLVKGSRSNEGDVNKFSEAISTGSHPSTQETGLGPKERERLGILSGESEMRAEADDIADFLSSQKGVFNVLDNDEDDDVLREGTEPFDRPLQRATINVDEEIVASMASGENDDDFDSDYGLLTPEQTVLFRVYSDDTDDQVLDEIKPRFIIMYEPNQDFVRRIECYRSSNPGLAVRVYFMIYQYSCEEHKFLAGIRREKEAFERLIKERGNMVIALTEDRRTGSTSEGIIKTISTRIAGGKQVATMPSQVIVDMREFRSTLPSLLHASKLLVIPATLTVGDYILAPDICVERKSIPDLVQSFSSGRLYTQCELMSVHYKQPILLIEFEEHKSFSLDTVDEMKSYAKYTGKYPAKKKPIEPPSDTIVATSIQSKLVLLTLSFPRLRILWSSSPYATADIFNDLKLHHTEPNAAHAVAVGAEEDPEAGAGVNQAAEELLRALPGITAKNVKYVMSKVRTLREFSGLSLPDVQDILGNDPGKACWEFMHRGE
ncbi:hypothetical protein M0805_009613 [Coniferiporia weirii]|nr:hypothetical protein M0805_009613 [Coniferiporia weirii]